MTLEGYKFFILYIMFKLGIFIFVSLILTINPTTAEKEELKAIVQSNGLFTKELYCVLGKEAEKNVFFSPISVHAVLSMIIQGAKGKTYDDIANALHVSNSSVAAEGYKDVLEHLNNIPDVQLSMANKVYVMQNLSLKPTFQEVNENKFLTGVEAVDFADTGVAAGKINGWIAEQTKNKINKLIEPGMLSDLTRLVLVNAIYFKGEWAKKFDSTATTSEKFYLNDNDSIDVKMMNNMETFLYKEDRDLDAKFLKLPYSNQDVSLIVILPNATNGIAELEKKLVDYDLTTITYDMYESEVMVKLPKFKIESMIDLKQPLSELGLQLIFDQNSADFSEMLQSPEQLYVSEVVQKAFIEVNEEGTEAAAATGAVVMAESFETPASPVEFFADHPFLILLQTSINGGDSIILFSGRISKPQ